MTVTQIGALTVATPSTPYAGGNGGNLTIPITGTNFAAGTTARLSLGGTTIDATSVYWKSASEIYATFDLAGVSPGDYTLTVSSGSQQVTVPGTVAVTQATTGNPVQLTITPPAFVSAGRNSVVYVTATNTSNNDVLAPLLELTADGATLKLPSQSTFEGSSLWFLATSPTGLAGALTPGESVQVEIQFQSITTNPQINFQLNTADDSRPMDWPSDESSLRIHSIPDAAWPIVYANFVADMGNTVGTFHAALAADATYLAQLGEPTNDAIQLLEFAIEGANAAYTTASLVTVTAESLPTPGMALTFQQSYLASVGRRYYQGILGQGWATNWDISAMTIPNGDGAVHMRGYTSVFTLKSDGSYLPESGSQGEILTRSGGAYRLVEPNGTAYQFNATEPSTTSRTLTAIESPPGTTRPDSSSR